MNDINNTEIIGFHLPEEPHGCFSNWYPAEFELAGICYANSEQYMMYQKVQLGRRFDLADMIMKTRSPAKAKEYAGKDYFTEFGSIKPVWDRICRNVVKRGVRAKFAQNPAMLEELLGTGNAQLAECSRSDKIWGIGINLHDEAWKDVRNWRGKNYLGLILMELREEFRAEIALNGAVKFECFLDAEANEAWQMTAGELQMYPQYYTAIHTYADTLTDCNMRDSFFNGNSLDGWENAMRTNFCSGLPLAGFYEMKQEVYEIFRWNR
ncbi:MAG: NADAR family protein [Oscillospiraceae bacterium]